MNVLILFFLIAIQYSAWAHINLHDQPLLTGATSFTYEISTWTSTKPTVCFVTNERVSQCRRRRGIEEKPQMIRFHGDVVPSQVLRVEPTPVPRSFRPFLTSARIFSSFDDSFTGSMNILQQLQAKGRDNVITVGDCGMSTVNFSQFLSCLGMTVQQTTTLTATFTQTYTLSSGYTTMTVAGCTPAGFPFQYCPQPVDVSGTETQNETLSFRIEPAEPLTSELLPIESQPAESPNRVESEIFKVKMT